MRRTEVCKNRPCVPGAALAHAQPPHYQGAPSHHTTHPAALELHLASSQNNGESKAVQAVDASCR